MNTLQNLPIVLQHQDDGSVLAHCPLLPECNCKAPTRAQALRTMQQLVRHAHANHVLPPIKYEVIHLAVGSVTEDGQRLAKRMQRRVAPERPRIELL
ncbi:hypothetical protein LZC95_51285 [Pendulispora brunnea]|uniref:Uncharacterized protein n=1 Tax=Pendulispora brunnea TaxID=2905690 RepID=A0ABZ2KD50_9BACT